MLGYPNGVELWLQKSLLSTMGKEEEVLLTITVPIAADDTQFRIGFDIKGVRSKKWIAITTGSATWNTHELKTAAGHLESILACVVDLVQGVPRHRDGI